QSHRGFKALPPATQVHNLGCAEGQHEDADYCGVSRRSLANRIVGHPRGQHYTLLKETQDTGKTSRRKLISAPGALGLSEIVVVLRMSAIGPKRTSLAAPHMAALMGKADMMFALRNDSSETWAASDSCSAPCRI